MGMLHHLAAACRQAREQAGLDQADIANAARTSVPTVSRFENASSWPVRIGVDELVDAYARELGVGPAELWADALERLRRSQ